jgi:hypothetical protein
LILLGIDPRSLLGPRRNITVSEDHGIYGNGLVADFKGLRPRTPDFLTLSALAAVSCVRTSSSLARVRSSRIRVLPFIGVARGVCPAAGAAAGERLRHAAGG